MPYIKGGRRGQVGLCSLKLGGGVGVGDDKGDQKLLPWGQPESGLAACLGSKMSSPPLPPLLHTHTHTHTHKKRGTRRAGHLLGTLRG